MSNVKLIVGSLAISALLTATGCGGDIQVHSYDLNALTALEQHGPKYELDNKGRVVKLKLDKPGVDDSALQHVKELTELNTLSLYESSVSDDGLANLTGLGRLQSLGLGNTSISDKGLVHLAQIPSLKWLWLSNSKATEAGISSLKKAKPELNVYE